MPTYYLHKETERRLPDGTKFYDAVKYKDLYHENYLKKNKWVSRKFGEVTYSNDQRRSFIQNNLPRDYLNLFMKGKLYEILQDQKYVPSFFTFEIKDPFWEEDLLHFLETCETGLWFLKKTGELTYGGYDVFPFHIKKNRDNALDWIIDKIKVSNSSVKYQSDEFVIQKGIENIYLTPDLRKFDLRTYGLIVWENKKFSFYYFKYMLMRKSTMPYDVDSDELNVQLTNTTQTKLERKDLYGLTELIDESYSWYSDIYPKTMKTYTDVCIYIRDLKNTDLSDKGYHLIGLDFLPSYDGTVYLLEINKHPAIYYDEERMVGLHHRMEYRMFTDSYFDTILKSGKIEQTPKNFMKIKF
jgi:hypothetical protein